MAELFAKYEIKSENQNMPFIHSMFARGSCVVVGLETGHILALPLHDLRRPKFFLQATLNRVVSCCLWDPLPNKHILLSADNADSFCLFDYEQRVGGNPTFLQKYRTPGEPVQILGHGTRVLLATASPQLSMYSLRQ